MPLQLRDLADLNMPLTTSSGQPMSVDLGLIDEDPAQPRTVFDPVSLQELASTIADRGVCQPISVRAHPDVPGRYMLNFGARRLRAARLAGQAQIPAFLSETGDGYDQVIENEQREPLTPMELAVFVQRRTHAGESLAEIARHLGKSRSYLTLVSALIDAPDWLLDLYRSGKCRGMTELYELRRLHEVSPDVVQRWIDERELISRTDLAALKVELPVANRDPVSSPLAEESGRTESASRTTPKATRNEVTKSRGTKWAGHCVLQADYRHSVVTIDLSAAPEGDGTVYVLEPDGGRCVVRASDLQLLRVVAG